MTAAVGAAVVAAIEEVLRDSGRGGRPVEPSMLLAADLGLDSLDLAQTIVLLERSLGRDPFRAPDAPAAAVRTVSDLVMIYSRALDAP